MVPLLSSQKNINANSITCNNLDASQKEKIDWRFFFFFFLLTNFFLFFYGLTVLTLTVLCDLKVSGGGGSYGTEQSLELACNAINYNITLFLICSCLLLVLSCEPVFIFQVMGPLLVLLLILKSIIR
jgi:hypothetical protein